MKKQITLLVLFLLLFNYGNIKAQELTKNTSEKKPAKLFSEHTPLPFKLSFSIKELKRSTNDSTYIPMQLNYGLKDDTWQPMDVQLRARGNYRLKNCYFPPLKLKIKKSESKKSVFRGHKTLKMVLPCLTQKDKDDNIIKEYLAYKLYEVISQYHFRTRLIELSFEELRNKKTKTHQLKGFLIEDNSLVAKRFDGKILERFIHPLNQEKLSSLRNTFFQFMIGNTDFSQAYMHNVELFFIDNKMIPIPYDFDMSGLVNTSYAVVSEINNQKLQNNSVTQRLYRGFQRDLQDFEQVRQEFLSKKSTLLSIMDAHSHYFDNPQEFTTARDYIMSFYGVLHDDKLFKKRIVEKARNE